MLARCHSTRLRCKTFLIRHPLAVSVERGLSGGWASGCEKLFAGRKFDREIIVPLRWYLRFKLSLRDLVEMMAEHGLPKAHTTIMR